MSFFAYEVVDSNGRRKRGEVEADSERSARQQLKSRGWVVRDLKSVSEKRNGEGATAGRLSSHETAAFLQQLSTLTATGMPLVEALGSIADGLDRKKSRRTVALVRQSVVEGGSLADALKAQGFDEVVCNMIAAGEETGQLDAVTLRLAELIEHRTQLNQELLSATLYPTIIFGFSFLVMIFLLAVVVPQIVSVFERTGADLPILTKVVIALSTFLRDNGFLLIFIVAASGLAFSMGMRSEGFRYRKDTFLLATPGLGKLLIKVNTARFARTLGMLLSGGVSALPAMLIANQSFSLLPLRDLGESAREELREGGHLGAALGRGSIIPHMALRLISVGEQSGKLDQMLLRVADTYEREVSVGVKRVLTVMEPLLILLMAVLVGTLALAVLLPIIQMNELVR